MPIGCSAAQLVRRLVERVARGQPALVHRRRRERGEADHVADRVDVVDLGPVVLVDASRPRLSASSPAGSRPSSSVTPWRPAEYITVSAGDPLAGDQGRDRAARPLDRDVATSSPNRKDTAVVAQVELQRLDDLRVAELQHLRSRFSTTVTRRAERGEHRGVLDADHPGADHDQRGRDLLQLEDPVGVEHPRVVEGDLGRPGRAWCRWRSRSCRADQRPLAAVGRPRPRPCAGRRTAPSPRPARRGCGSSCARTTSISRPITCWVRASRSCTVMSCLTR